MPRREITQGQGRGSVQAGRRVVALDWMDRERMTFD